MKNKSRGFSLVELLIAMAIAATLATAMAAIFANSVKTREQVDKDGQRIEVGRYALDVLSADIRMAGYYGNYLPRSSAGLAWPTTVPTTPGLTDLAWMSPSFCPNHPLKTLAVADLGWSNAGPIRVPVPVMSYELHDYVGAFSATNCLSNYKSGTDILVVRRTSTAAHTPGGTTVTAGDVYFQAKDCSNTSSGPDFIVDTDQTAFTLKKMSCASGDVTKIRKYMVRVYYIATCNICSGTGADTIPTLKVAELGVSGGSLAMSVSTVAAGIEDMHFEFGVDTSGDGAIDGFDSNSDGTKDKSYLLSNETASPSSASPAFDWWNVMSVKTYMLARDMETTSGYTDSKSYVMGQKTVTKNDGYRRAVFSSTMRLVNPSGAREL